MSSLTNERAIELRHRRTKAERKLWLFLKAKQVKGLKFRQQEPIGKYIVDFVCYSQKLIIELDGGQHAEEQQGQHDSVRDDWLRSQGFVILRIWNTDVMTNIEGVWDTIVSSLPLDGGGEERRG